MPSGGRTLVEGKKERKEKKKREGGHFDTSWRGGTAAAEGVISVDTKKKEFVGDSEQRSWEREKRKKGNKGGNLGRSVPYGVYELARQADK